MNEKTLIDVTTEQVLKNNGKDGNRLWVVIHEKVYDVTDFDHPGGRNVLTSDSKADMDKGLEFDDIHSSKDKKDALKYLIGKLID